MGDLGANAIYFTPIFQSACNHRYHTHDDYQVDPLLGGRATTRWVWLKRRRNEEASVGRVLKALYGKGEVTVEGGQVKWSLPARDGMILSAG
jgi:hypothetical protein